MCILANTKTALHVAACGMRKSDIDVADNANRFHLPSGAS